MIVHPDSVEEYIPQILELGKTQEEALRYSLRTMADHVTQHPRYYLFFGPYWWVFKTLVRKYVGDERVVRWARDYDDAIIRKRYTTGDDLYDFTAAQCYQWDHCRDWINSPQRHEVVDETGEDTYTYEFYDPDVRRR